MSGKTNGMSRWLVSMVVLGCMVFSLPAFGQYLVRDQKIAGIWNNNGFGGPVAIGDGVIVAAQSASNVALLDASTGALIADLSAPEFSSGLSLAGVAIGGGVVAVGAPYDNTNGSNTGSVFLFDVNTGAEIGRLYPLDVDANDFFGFSLAIDDGLLVVGAPEAGQGPGSVYIFDLATELQLHRLVASDGDLNDTFGYAVDIDNGTVIVGADGYDDDVTGILDRGTAYLFDASTGTQIMRLEYNSTVPTGGRVGRNVGIDGGVAVAASEQSRRVFVFDTTSGVQLFELESEDRVNGDRFGGALSIDNGILAVGAGQGGDHGPGTGSAYIFDVSTGDQIAKLLRVYGKADDEFGSSISVRNGLIAVGARFDGAGSVYTFTVPEEPCPADLTNDGVLDISDVFTFLSSYNAGCP